MNIFKFEPIYMERVWGGNNLQKKFSREIKSTSKKIGESWEVVDRDDAMSVIANGNLKGKSLRFLISNFPKKIMGPYWNPKKKFPILVKWLDCKERLSLQVHPPKKMALQLNGEPKTENWYVYHANKKAGLFLGLKNKTSKATFRKAIKEQNVESLCHRVKSTSGDSVLVESGRIHAIDAGNLILEIQQNSDTTYRVYDWGRIGINKKPRELHIDNSIKCINFKDLRPSVIKSDQSNESILADCKHFRIRKIRFEKNIKMELKKKNEDCSIIHVISGLVKVGNTKIMTGEQAVSPFESKCLINPLKNSTCLVTDSFLR